MIANHCRHRTYPQGKDWPVTCAAGVRYEDVRLRTPGPLWEREPCAAKGRANGATCPNFAPWTPEEIEADKQEWATTFDALDKGVCPDCGATLINSGAWRACPVGHVREHTHKESM